VVRVSLRVCRVRVRVRIRVRITVRITVSVRVISHRSAGCALGSDLPCPQGVSSA